MLLQKGYELEERDFFKDTFTEGEIKELASLAPLTDLFAWRSPSFKNLGLKGQDLSEPEMINLMLQEPRLVRRPVVRVGNKLIIGANLKTLEAEL